MKCLLRRNELQLVGFLTAMLTFVANSLAVAAEPLDERIDAAIEAPLSGTVAPPADDSEFLRRIYLDLTGCIPSVDEARAFLDDDSDDKRARLIDRLLASPYYVRRMQYFFDHMLMQRRGDKHVKSDEWEAFLYESLSENKPYDDLVREILTADGATDETRAAARFYLDREVEPNSLTRDIGRLFLGRDMQCAQCHDHPLIDGYKQDHYYGLFAFVSRSYLYTDKKLKKSFLAEKGEGDVTFKSVFDPGKGTQNTGPHLIDAAMIAEPKFDKGQEYYVPPGKDVLPVPKFSRRQQLADAITRGDVPDFSRNIVNRLWAMMMGRGLVDPIEMHHADNPPSHPELLDLLAGEFVAMDYDIKEFLRQLARTRTYQRTSASPEEMTEAEADPAKFAVGALKPLTAEQLAWSMMEATGVIEPERQSQRSRLSADSRLADLLTLDPERENVADTIIERGCYNALKKHVPQFVSLYGSSPGENELGFQASVQQALFVANGPVIKGWLAGGLAPRLAKLEDVNQLADELYLSTLSRQPTEEERLEVAEYLIRQATTRSAAIEEMAWALLASAEFSFNH